MLHSNNFNVYCTDRIYPRDTKSMENLARYIIRASFLQERMNYVRQEYMVIYKSKDGINTRQFDATYFIASLCSHIPNMSEQTVKYYGFYSNVCRGRRKRQKEDNSDFIIAGDEHTKEFHCPTNTLL
ncbi:MAG: transposase [Candidatus Humimicrobiaceae bacterium]